MRRRSGTASITLGLTGLAGLCVLSFFSLAPQLASQKSAAAQARPTAGALHNDSDLPQLATWPQPIRGSLLRLTTLHASGADSAIVAGQVRSPEGDHAALFATSDGGNTWRPLGPAIPDSEWLSIARRGGHIWAIGQHRDRAQTSLLLHSSDAGRSWTQQDLHLSATPQRGLAAAQLQMTGPQYGMLDGHLADSPEQRATWFTEDGGSSWDFLQQHPAPLAQLQELDDEIVTPSGWSWRLNDSLIERRDPDTGIWRAVASQPVDAYDEAQTDVFFVALPSTTKPAV